MIAKSFTATEVPVRAPVSVVIATRNAQPILPVALRALGEGLNAGLLRELIICDTGSTDATQKIAEAAGAQIVQGDLAEGIACAKGHWLMVLPAEAVLEDGWTDAVARALHAPHRYCFHRARGQAGLGHLVCTGSNLWTRFTGRSGLRHGLLVPRADVGRSGRVKLLSARLFDQD
ncbi:glycosyltransferase [Sagittula sp. SSi028]|uniref:glycosyltransferase n=1 Tax=Sagittula sp. SSi028 TaxID=3400636 RepID=UPI003AF6EDD7